MMFPAYATVNKIFILDDAKTGVECSHFMVFMQGYKVDVGFRIHRSSQKINRKRAIDYTFERYGWSSKMLNWRSLKFRQQMYYLEDFFKFSEKDKIDSFLFKNKCVLLEKSYKWPSGMPSGLGAFTR
jgi:hypothetical protein